MSTQTKTEDHEFNLAPHEKLDEIDLRTNDDGSVQVRILEWEEVERLDEVHVSFRTPAGEVKTETMEWPQSKDDKYKFIRLIEETPYTLRTAEQINEDDDLWLNANPESWKLDLPESKTLKQRVPGPYNSVVGEIGKLVFYPLTILAYGAGLMDYDTHKNAFDGEYSKTYFDDDIHRHRTQAALKAAVCTIIWVMFLVLIL